MQERTGFLGLLSANTPTSQPENKNVMMSMTVTMHPVWQTGAVALVLAISCALLLQVLVQRLLPVMLRQGHTTLGAAIFSVIGTTYAVLLAFMATTAWSQYNGAQELSRHEANLIGNIYEASRGLADPIGSSIRDDLSTYLAKIIYVEWPAQIAGRSIAPAEPLLIDLSRRTLASRQATTADSNVQSYIIGASSALSSLRRDRRLATHGTVPNLVWLVLVSGGTLLVCFSFLLGAPTLALHMVMTAALVTSGVLVLLLIIDLSSPFQGSVTISPDPYIQTLAEIRAAP